MSTIALNAAALSGVGTMTRCRFTTNHPARNALAILMLLTLAEALANLVAAFF